MDSIFKFSFFDVEVAKALNDGIERTEEALNSISEAIKGVSMPATETAALVEALENIQGAMDRQSMALSLLNANDVTRDWENYKFVDEESVSDVLINNALYDVQVEEKKLDDGTQNLKHFSEAFYNSTVAEMKKVIGKMDFDDMKKAYGIVADSMEGTVRYYEADVVKARTGVSPSRSSHFHAECKKTVSGVVVEVDGYDLTAMIAQELLVQMYTKKDTTYKGDGGANLMAVGIAAKTDDDGEREAYDLAKTMLMAVTDNARFAKNADVKSMFVEELTGVKDDLDDFYIDADNFELLEKIRSLDLVWKRKPSEEEE